MRTPYRIPTLITLLTFLSLLVPAEPAQANTVSGAFITVNTLVDDGNNNNGTCSLREAVRAANTNSPVDACPAGNGADTILLGAGVYQLSIVGIDEEFAETGDLDIREDLVIQGMGMNSTIVDGGGIDRVFHIYWVDPHPVVRFERLTIRNGSVTTDRNGGAGILNEFGTLTLHIVSLEENYSYYYGVEPAVGGGMDNLGVATLIDSNVSNNGADDGGGIFSDGELSIIRSTLNGNTATVEFGGALDNLGSATLEDVTISDNSASSSGGGIFSDGTLWINDSTLSNNTAAVHGGALVNGYLATLENVTISGNSADKGGGIYNSDTLELHSTTIISNTANLADQGGNIQKVTSSATSFVNTLVANSLSGPNCAGSGSTISGGYNLEDTNSCNFDQPSDLFDVVDPLVGPLADNGGPTLTHALIWPSPAIDQGDDLACPSTDQRGASRAWDHCDIGAYEYDGVFPDEFVFLPLVVR